MSNEEYVTLVNSISNEQVPEVMFATILKIHLELEGTIESMTEAEVWRYGLFKSFFKIYNTILRLSEGTSYVFNPKISYIDIKSINTQIRACHELYLLFQYITTNTIGDGKLDEKEFKYECYRLAGAIDSKRTYEKIKNFVGYQEQCDIEIEKLRNEISECRQIISGSEIYNLLSSNTKNAVRNGHWRVDVEKRLSWNDLLAYTPMSRVYGTLEYHVLSMYAHTSHASLELEANHDYDMISALAHLYKLTALMSFSTLNAFGLNYNSFLEKREVALIYDLMTIENKLISEQS
ncbi:MULTISPECIES: DUF5677 domain-containing protein [Alcaligenes]|uniref:DUF5677 domain-containing protein n=1 Tax=Alcaligenes TaxID=507 RepID=UPI002CCDC8B2|nr:DUF5677 domain-containing protein [Alcaligenes phenolicus]HRO19002.1 DUF5677 domain-containing protein [Alcaligenes phenolicus]HRP14839.1 DUF5677 domain-containing protein [Alcaligenes phenolicus]